jgi:hypothetical protein
MLITKLKLAVGAVMVAVALGASGLAYRAAGPAAPAGGKPLTELEALRRENELLKLNLEVVLEKVRAQEAELRPFRAGVTNRESRALLEFWLRDAAKAREEYRKRYESIPDLRTQPGSVSEEDRRAAKALWERRTSELEATLKALRDAPDKESQRRAADALEKALKNLRKHLDQRPPPGP